VSSADLSRLVLLGALWGASFLFMRMGAGEFGPLALVFVRVAGAALLLMPLVLLLKRPLSARAPGQAAAID
jgi:drug/metabolite transporter (DMT)-like permease